MKVHIGCSGWFYSHWRGIFYPAQEIGTDRWFAYYANVFTTVELNAPFYRWPKPATVRRWQRQAPPSFRYSVKVNQSITHERRMVHTKSLVDSFCTTAGVLGDQLGCFLFQLPPSYHFTAARLKTIVAQLDPRYRNVVEFRHRSWWRPSVYRALAARQIVFCTVSAPRLPDTLPPAGKVVYARFHGTSRWYEHDYSDAELRAWADRLIAAQAEEAWVYFNNDRRGYAVKNALRFRRILRSALGSPAQNPDQPAPREPNALPGIPTRDRPASPHEKTRRQDHGPSRQPAARKVRTQAAPEAAASTRARPGVEA